MATLHFELVSPERVLYSGEVESVLLPGTEGDMTVLPGHGGRVLVRGGFAEINGAGVTVLAERATPVEELTPDSIDAEILEMQTERDGTASFEAKQAADMIIAQLEEAKEALKF